MSSTELSLVVASILEVCYDIGKEIVETCKTFRKTDDRLAEDIMQVEAYWLRFETQLQIVQKAVLLMGAKHCEILQNSLQAFCIKLQTTNSQLSGVKKVLSSFCAAKHIEARRFEFSKIRDSLVDAISKLEEYRVAFDLTWYLLMMVVNPQIDMELSIMVKEKMATMGQEDASSAISDVRDLRGAFNTDSRNLISTIILQQGSLYPGTASPVPFSSVVTARLADTGQIVLLDPVTCASWPSEQAAPKDIRTFALRLRNADPFKSGLLECRGILRDDRSGHEVSSDTNPMFCLVFRLPEKDICVESLWGRIRGGPETEHESLHERVTLARQLVQAVAYVHVYGLVHKNIRPDNILLFSRGHIIDLGLTNTDLGDDTGHLDERDGGPEEFCALVGFDILRNDDNNTPRLSDDDWRKNLYRHPSTQGKASKTDYDMRHDIYSVGVCLLEIGLWENFVRSDGWSANPSASECTLGSLLGYGDMEPSECLENPDYVKVQLLRLSRNELKRRMGTKYSKVVETCLTCLDDGNEEFGDDLDFRDEEGVAMGVKFIESVVVKLGEIEV